MHALQLANSNYTKTKKLKILGKLKDYVSKRDNHHKGFFIHYLSPRFSKEQKRKRLDQPLANKTIRNRKCFLPSIPDWL
jgi:hypothetical protein